MPHGLLPPSALSEPGCHTTPKPTGALPKEGSERTKSSERSSTGQRVCMDEFLSHAIMSPRSPFHCRNSRTETPWRAMGPARRRFAPVHGDLGSNLTRASGGSHSNASGIRSMKSPQPVGARHQPPMPPGTTSLRLRIEWAISAAGRPVARETWSKRTLRCTTVSRSNAGMAGSLGTSPASTGWRRVGQRHDGGHAWLSRAETGAASRSRSRMAGWPC